MRPIVAADLMTPEVLSVAADMDLGELAAFLVDHEISGAVVRDDRGQPIGVVSLTDLAAAAADNAELGPREEISAYYQPAAGATIDPAELEEMESGVDGLTASDIMTPQVYSVSIDATVSEVARTLLDGHLHRLLVLDEDELVGVISVSDLLGLLVEED